jgi:hypothetical protein
VSDVAPPFVGFIELSQMSETTRDELLGKMLSGEHPAYVYSSEADGRLEPARITPAEFFKAWRRAQQEAGCDDCLDASGWPLKKMGPFQIRVPDRDIRRDRGRLMRRTIAVPHWIYVLKADLSATDNRNGPGAVDLYDWDEIEQVVANLWQVRGDFDLPDNRGDDWKSQNSVIEHVKNYLQKHNRKIPGDTQIKKRVGEIIGKLRRP